MAVLEDKNFIRTFNIGLIVTMLGLFAIGLITLMSATKGPGMAVLYRTQLLWFGIGLLISIAIVWVDSQVFEKLAYPSYAVCLLLLGLVLVFGKVGGGSQRWIGFAGFHIQPSEFSKIAIVFTLAKYFSDSKLLPPFSLRQLFWPILLVTPFFILILLQPDLGTAGVLSLVAGSMVLYLGVSWRSLIIVLVIAVTAVPLAYKYVLRDYQRDRVKTFWDPGRDARGSGYNALQCRIAVGSGRLFGKGYMKGTQAQLNFIPEQHTDFIFSVFAEERGLAGVAVLLSLYLIYAGFALRSVTRARDRFEMLLAFGLTSIVLWHAFINIGMVSGLLPIVGVGLPFFSYGGSSLLTFMFSTALLLNLGRKRYIF